MLSSGENDPQPTPTDVPNPERNVRIVTGFRVSTHGIAIAACVVILLLLTAAMYAGFSVILRPLVTLLGIAAAIASLVSRGHISVRSRRAATPDDIRNLPDDVRAMIPEGAKKVYDLKDLPPSIANNPEVRKLFEKAAGRGAWVKVQTSGHSSIPASVASAEGVAERAANAVTGETADVQPVKLEKRVTRISFGVSSKPDTHNQTPAMDADGIAAGAMGEKIEPVAFGPGIGSFVSKAMTWAAFLLIVAALAAGVVAWMSLKTPGH